MWLAVRLPGFLIGLLCGVIANNLPYHTASSEAFRLEMLIGGWIGFLFSDSMLHDDHRQSSDDHGQSRKEGSPLWRRFLPVNSLINGILMALAAWLILGDSYQQRGVVIGGIGTLLLSIALAPTEQIHLRRLLKRYVFEPIGKCLRTSLPVRVRDLGKHLHTYLPVHVRDVGKRLWYLPRGNFGIMDLVGSSAWQKHLKNGLLVGLAYAICDKLIQGPHDAWLINLFYILRDSTRYTLLGILLSVLLLNDRGEIRPSEMIVWSWSRFWRFLTWRKHLKNSLLVLLYVSLIYGLSYGLNNGLKYDLLGDGLPNGVAFGISFGFSIACCYWLILGLFQGLSSESMDNKERIRPNEGIRRSLRNMLIMTIIGFCIGVPLYVISNTLAMGLKEGIRTPLSTWVKPQKQRPASSGSLISLSHGVSPKKPASQPSSLATKEILALSKGVVNGWRIGLSYCWIAGIVAGLLLAILSGGLAYLRHSLLRLLLWRTGVCPLNIPHFLDYTAERILLRKVGGGVCLLTYAPPALLLFFASYLILFHLILVEIYGD